jgi:toxin ParE1/3/4
MANSLVIKHRAKLDLAEIIDYLDERSTEAALRFFNSVYDEFHFLSEHPGVGSIRMRASPRTRKLRFWPIRGFRNYLIFYEPRPDGVEIVRVLHGARDVDDLLEDEV